MYPKVHLKPELLRKFHSHKHPWVFSGAIEKVEGDPKQLHGELVSVYVAGKFIFSGTFNMTSQISVRAYTWNEHEKIDKNFFERRLTECIEMRKKFVLTDETTACRLVFAESDFLPGFVLDKYNDSYILQIHTLGAERLKSIFVSALQSLVDAKMILEKSDIPSRKHEGLTRTHEQVLFGEKVENEEILEYGIKYDVSFTGQKTGFFLDQRENRKLLEEYVIKELADKEEPSLKVLNMFSYSGGFSLAAFEGGATHVTSVDISEDAIALARKNAELNGIEDARHTAIAADGFEYMKKMEKDAFDVIVLDPPAFVKAKKDLAQGLKGYLTLNQMALAKLPKGGLLLTCSCSSLVSETDFMHMLSWASHAAGAMIQVLETRTQPSDHPLTPYFPEGRYLKCYLVRKV